MQTIQLEKNHLPLWKGGNGNLKIGVAVNELQKPLPITDNDLLTVEFGVGGDQGFTLGNGQTMKLGFKAGTSLKMIPIWQESREEIKKVLTEHGLEGFFATHPEHLVLAFLAGANADLSLAGSFSYTFLSAQTTLQAGVDGQYVFLRAYPATTPTLPLIREFFADMRLPAHVTEPLQPGEVIAFDFGGYLKLGAGVAVGYELKGSPSFDIGQLQLSEHYGLSVVGSLGFNANVAGRFKIEVREALGLPGWVQVIVHRHRASEFKVAADVNVKATSEIQGLPETGVEFLGAALGVNSKNWLNLLQHVSKINDFDQLEKELDRLAKEFLGEWVGKAFAELPAEFGSFLEQVHTVVESYQNLDNAAITLVDRYWGRLDQLTDTLQEIAALASWESLKGEQDSKFWEVFRQLADGDPLSWILGGETTLVNLQTRVNQTLALIRDEAHVAIRSVIGLAKEKFGLNELFNLLSTIDSVDELKALADQKAIGLVERLFGKTIKELSTSEFGKNLKKTLGAAKTFEDRLYRKFKEAASQSASFHLHSEYSRASERDALIDVMLNVSTDEGKALMRDAGQGDFQAVLASIRPDLVKVNKGSLTHKMTKASAFQINIIGWHRGWNYQGFDRVIVETEQHFTTEANGGLTVFTTMSLNNEKERKRNGERMYTNFLLRFLGESHNVMSFDKTSQQFLVDVLTGMAATYQLSFDDSRTRQRELEFYLSFASDFDLGAKGATIDQLLPLLPKQDSDDFGHIKVNYEVRYTPEGLQQLFRYPFNEPLVRLIMRKMVLANYLTQPYLAGIGWCYWTQDIYNLWKKEGATFTNHFSSQEFKPIQCFPFRGLSAAPERVVLRPEQLRVLASLFEIEDLLVSGLKKLDGLMQNGVKISPHDFEQALADIGSALKSFDGFDEGVNTIFGVFDQLIKFQSSTAMKVRASSLTLISEVKDKEVTIMFLA